MNLKLLSVLMSSVLLVACGSGSSGGSSDETPNKETPDNGGDNGGGGNGKNTAPVFGDVSPITLDEDGNFNVVLTAQDAENDSLTFEITSADAQLNASLSGAELTLTPAANYHGESTLQLTVSDGKLTDQTSVSVTVASVNDEPVIGELVNLEIKNTAPGRVIPIPVSDVDGDPVQVSIVSYDDSLLDVVTKANELWVKPYEYAVGDTSIKLEATDGVEQTQVDLNVSIKPSYAYFSAIDDGNVTGYELWRTDGTNEGTHMVKDINEGINSSRPIDFYHWQDKVYFSLIHSGENSHVIWVSDGTAEGTTNLHDTVVLENVTSKAGWGNDLYFLSKPDGDRFTQLWKTDGSKAGTNLVFKGVDRNFSNMSDLYVFNNKLYFVGDFMAIDGKNYGREIWSYDGENVVLLKDINPGFQAGVANTGYTSSVNFFEYQNKLCFKAQEQQGNLELWCSDGTTEGTYKAFDLNGTASSNYYGMTKANGKLYFIATTAETGYEPYRFDGQTVELIKDIRIVPFNAAGSQNYPGPSFNHFTQVGDKLHFFATDGFGTNRYEIDLTEALSDTNPLKTGDPAQLSGFAVNLYGTLIYENNNNALFSRKGDVLKLLTDFSRGGSQVDSSWNFSRPVVNGKVMLRVDTSGIGVIPWAVDAEKMESLDGLKAMPYPRF